ncbi:MAG: carboxymuconolactone decarboxylase family protein [Burkholderiales bacterium]
MNIFSIVAGCLFAVAPGLAQSQSQPRLKPLAESEMSEAQLKAARELASGPRGKINPNGPNFALLRSPELMERTQKVGEYLRYKSSIPVPLNEFAILVTARQWNAQIEWIAHHELALKAGVSAAMLADLAQGRRPAGMKDDEAIVYDFCKEIHDNKEVSDATYKRVVDRFGERGVMDLIGLTGYYTMLAMVLNVTRVALPEGNSPPLRALK